MFQHNQECAADLMQKTTEEKKIEEFICLKNRLVHLGKK